MGFAVTSYSPSVVGLLSAQIASNQELLNLNSSQTTLGVNENRYSLFLEPCEAMDNKVISLLDDINSDKNSIVSLGTTTNFFTYPQYYATENDANVATQDVFGNSLSSIEAFSNLNFSSVGVTSDTSFLVGSAVSSSTGGTGIVAFSTSSTIGVGFSVFVRDVSGSFGIGATVYIGTPGIAFSSLSLVNYVGTGKIYPDTVITTYYPDLEPPNTSVQSPFDNEQFRILDNSKKGLGIANTFYQNSLSDPNILGTLVFSNDTISELGEVFAFDTISGSSVKSDIDDFNSNISTKRSGISSYNNGSSTIKNYKKGYSVNVWSLKTSNLNIQNDTSALQAAINILNDPANGGPY